MRTGQRILIAIAIFAFIVLLFCKDANVTYEDGRFTAKKKCGVFQKYASCIRTQPRECKGWMPGEKRSEGPFGKMLRRCTLAINAFANPLQPPQRKLDISKFMLENVHFRDLFAHVGLQINDIEGQTIEFAKILLVRNKYIFTRYARIGADKTQAQFLVDEGYTLNARNVSFHGCQTQFAFGQVMSQLMWEYNVTTLKLHPVFTILWQVSGGIPGYGNSSIGAGGTFRTNDIEHHAIFHDAFGMLFVLFGKGPGYGYCGGGGGSSRRRGDWRVKRVD
jgi:hypothetical protein